MHLSEEHIRFGQTVFYNLDALRYFLADIKNKHPDFFEELGKSCEEFVEHAGLPKRDRRDRRIASELFLAYACAQVGTLYKANNDEIPPDTLAVFKSLKEGCDSMPAIKKRFDLFCMVNREWAEYYMLCAQNEGLCEHGLGAVYAFVEAFLEAQKLQEKRMAESEDIAKRTSYLSPKWLEGLEINLPEGRKNIGEE